MLDIAVPAIDPWIPALPRTPANAATSGKLLFKLTMSAPAYLIASARSIMDIFEDRAAFANWSPTVAAPAASIWKVDITLVIKSAVPPLPPNAILVAPAT